MKRIAAIAVVLAVSLSACSSNDEGIAKGTTATSPPATPAAPTVQFATQTATATVAATATPSPTATATPDVPRPTLEVAYFHARTGERLFRVAVAITNPAAKTIEGLKMRWDAYSADNAIVGGIASSLPPIAGGQTFYYVGGAGGANLTGDPASVKVTVVDGGRFTDAPSILFTTEPGTVLMEEYPLSKDKQARASANVVTGDKAVDRFDTVVTVILRDAAGAIVGADFDRPVSLPESIPPGTKFRSEIRFIDVTGTPVKAEFTSYAFKK